MGSQHIIALGGGGGGSAEMELIGEHVLTVDGTSLSVSSIPATYKDLVVVIKSKTSDTALATDTLFFNVGAGTVDTGASAYSWTRAYSGTGAGTATDNADTKVDAGVINGDLTSPADNDSFAITDFVIADYLDTDNHRAMQGHTSMFAPASNVYYKSEWWALWRDTANALDIITAVPAVGANFRAGSYMRVYGVGQV